VKWTGKDRRDRHESAVEEYGSVAIVCKIWLLRRFLRFIGFDRNFRDCFIEAMSVIIVFGLFVGFKLASRIFLTFRVPKENIFLTVTLISE